MIHRRRVYRDFTASPRWTAFAVKVETTDLYIRAARDLSALAGETVRRLRRELREHIERHPDFLSSYSPLPAPKTAPEAAAMMYRAADIAGTGPMAAVAGAIAELTGKALLGESEEVIVENGGDIWMKLNEPAAAALYAGEFRFAGKLKIRVAPEDTPCGICTSSAVIGPSVSFGKADAVTVTARDAALADALATECCNRIRGEEDIDASLAYAMEKGATGIVAVYRDLLGVSGSIELIG